MEISELCKIVKFLLSRSHAFNKKIVVHETEDQLVSSKQNKVHCIFWEDIHPNDKKCEHRYKTLNRDRKRRHPQNIAVFRMLVYFP